MDREGARILSDRNSDVEVPNTKELGAVQRWVG